MYIYQVMNLKQIPKIILKNMCVCPRANIPQPQTLTN